MKTNFFISNQWIKNNPIPDGKSSWGTFSNIEQRNQLIIKNILEKPMKTFKSEAEKKAKIYYESCLDRNDDLEQLGAKPMVEFLWKIGGWNVTHTGFNKAKWSLANTLKLLQNR